MSRLNMSLMLLVFTAGSVFADATEDIQSLLDENWQWRMQESPVFASMLGDRRNNDKWTDMSLDAIEARQDMRRDFLRRLLAIDSALLSEADQLNYDLFRRDLLGDIEGAQFKDYLMPINQRGGIQTIEMTAERIRMKSVEDFEDWLLRMAGVEQLIEQTRALQEAGRKQGYMPPKITMQRIPQQISAQLVEDPAESPFYTAFESMPDSIGEEDQERLREAARTLIDDSIVPAFRDYSRYFNDVYLPASRDSISASDLPNGEAFYEYRARLFTTTQWRR